MKQRNCIGILFRKELKRFFSDRRAAFTTLLLPGLMIYLLYSVMGGALTSQFAAEPETEKPAVRVIGLPASLQAPIEAAFSVETASASALQDEQQAVRERESALLAVFPDGFDAAVASYDPAAGQPAPNVALYYNSTDNDSAIAFETMNALLETYESGLANRFDVNRGDGGFDLADDRDLSGQFFSMMMPMLLMIFLFSGCVSVAPEAIAGEKERGTIATMLVTPMKRSHLAIGKIAALALIALLSGLSSTVGTVLSLPKLMAGATDSVSAGFYGVTDYLWLGLVILSTVLLLITLLSVLSAFAKTVKEATTYTMPVMILAMFVGVLAMFSGGAPTAAGWYLIPLYNSVQSMAGIFSFSAAPLQLLLCIASNLAYSALGVFVLTRLFCRESIIFSR